MSPNLINVCGVVPSYKFTRFGAIDVTKPNKCIMFGAIDVTKPCKLIGFGAINVTKSQKFIWFGAIDVTTHIYIYNVGGYRCHQTL
jgi:hypothetical protein